MPNFLTGKKTYLIAAAMAIASAAQFLGYITADQHQTITTLLLGGGLTTLRASVQQTQVAAEKAADSATIAADAATDVATRP